MENRCKFDNLVLRINPIQSEAEIPSNMVGWRNVSDCQFMYSRIGGFAKDVLFLWGAKIQDRKKYVGEGDIISR